MAELTDAVQAALRSDQTIDIVTIGARSGLPRTTEIWFTNIDDRIFICGTPAAQGGSGSRKRRDWLANLIAHPKFTFRLKESIHAELAAYAVEVTDANERRRIMSAPQTQWYREQVGSVDDLVAASPIVEVFFR